MREVTKTYKVYKFEELNEAAKSRVRDRIGHDVKESKCELLEEYLSVELWDKYHISNCEIGYSLTHSQGDGFCFYDVDLINIKTIKNKDLGNANPFEEYCIKHFTNEHLEMLEDYLEAYYLRVEKGNLPYQHSHTCHIATEYYWDDTKVYKKKVNDFIDELADKFNKIYHTICRDLERFGYDFIDNTYEDEIIAEIESRELEFLENGEEFYE